jgi:hypothetical protein
MIEALKQMVEALEYHTKQTRPISKTKEAIQAGKKAIAELENSLILMSEVNISNNFKQSQRTEQNFCSRCGKRTKDLTTIHTCTPPQD